MVTVASLNITMFYICRNVHKCCKDGTNMEFRIDYPRNFEYKLNIEMNTNIFSGFKFY